MSAMRLANVVVDEVYVPVMIEEENWAKKAKEVLVMVMEPCSFQTIRAS